MNSVDLEATRDAYWGWTDEDGTQHVRAPGDKHLPTYSAVRDHSPALVWGGDGRSCRQLALAILIHEIGTRRAERCYCAFAREHVIDWQRSWYMTSTMIRQWLEIKHLLKEIDQC